MPDGAEQLGSSFAVRNGGLYFYIHCLLLCCVCEKTDPPEQLAFGGIGQRKQLTCASNIRLARTQLNMSFSALRYNNDAARASYCSASEDFCNRLPIGRIRPNGRSISSITKTKGGTFQGLWTSKGLSIFMTASNVKKDRLSPN
jgi:hypothetical protein